MIPYMPFYVGDYLADTMHLNTVQHGAYVLLIFHYWRNEGPIANNDETLANITKLTLDGWSATRSALAMFFEVTPETWSHKRINAELDKIKRLQAARRKGARITNKARAERPAERAAKRCISEPDSIHTEIESPTGFPKSETEAEDMVATAGIPKGFATDVYQQLLGRGYKDGAGITVTNFAAHVKSRFSRKQSEKQEQRYYAHNSTSGKRRTDGGEGTANDGKTNQYRGVGKVV